MTRSALCASLFLVALQAPLQSTEPSPTFETVYSEEAYQSDLDTLVRTLVETHPRPFQFTSEPAFRQLVAEQKSKVSAQTTRAQFAWYCSSIIAAVGCGHTGMGAFSQEDAMLPDGVRFPVEAKIIDGRLYVTDPLTNADQLGVGDEIFSVNGQTLAEITESVFAHIASDGLSKSFPKQLFNGYLTAYLAYHFDFPSTYQVVVRGRSAPVILRPLESYSTKPWIHPTNPCQDELCLEWAERTAKLTIRTFAFYGDRFPKFKSFIDNSFAEIADRGADSLIVDVRSNGGGYSGAAAYMLRHLAKEPFTYFDKGSAGADDQKLETAPSKSRFKGPIYVLQDGDGGSATGHFLSLVKHHRMATLVGEESRATYAVNAHSQSFELPNTGLTYIVATESFFTPANGLPRHRGVLPDHQISPTIADYIDGSDTVLEYVLSLLSRAEASSENPTSSEAKEDS